MYEYAEKTSYRNKGGYVVGLGRTRAEAKKTLSILKADQWFRGEMATALEFDFVLYNANYDLFAYTHVHFHVGPSGELYKGAETTVFPVKNLYGGGTTAALDSSRTVTAVLMTLYGVLVAVLTFGIILYDLYNQWLISMWSG